MQQKKVPMRKCVGCGEMKPKKELVRIVRTPEGEITADPTGKKSGRGAYVCLDPECVKKAEKGRRLERAFACRVEPEVYGALAEAVAALTE
jgi:hypothetical protein